MAERVIPTLKKPVVRYRGKTSSEEYNQMTQDLYFDLTNLFTASNDNAERAEQVIRQLNIENMYLKTKVDELLARLGNIEDMLKQIQQGSTSTPKSSLLTHSRKTRTRRQPSAPSLIGSTK